MSIGPGKTEHLNECVEAFKNSKLGEIYLHSEEELKGLFMQGLSRKELFVALDENNSFQGYIWIALRGAFYGFPYCVSIAVKKESRGRGIGTALLEHYEKVGFENSDKLFILVSDFNPGAKKLYERIGYRQVGVIPGLFKAGVAENVLVKYRPGEGTSL